jgi:hypothetical protein
MHKKRSLSSLWRIAKTLELNPRVKGLYAVSWFLSADTGRLFPHLAWIRDMYADEGAYVVDMETASPDSGFMIGSEARRQLYAVGQFNPRRSLILWPRSELLAWAARHPELADHEDEPIGPVAPGYVKSSVSPRPVRSGPHNSRLNVWNGLALLNVDSGRYVFRVLLAPAMAACVISGLLLAWWATIPAFILVFMAAWIVQYYFFQ